MAPSSSGRPGSWALVVLSVFLVMEQLQSTNAAGLSFAREPDSEFIENGKVRFLCEPKDELQKFVEVRWFRNEVELTTRSKNVINMSKCGSGHALEVYEQERASYRCEISLNGSFPLRLVSRRAESIATTIGEFRAEGGSLKDRHVQVMEGATGVIPCGPLPTSEPPAIPVVGRDQRSLLDLSRKARFHAMPSGNVYVRRASVNDSGMYRCSAENPLTKQRREAPFRVFLVVQPRYTEREALQVNATIIHRPPERVEAVVGSNVTLECLGDGWPQPKVRWERVGSYLPGTVDAEGTLVLTSVIAKHSGLYECSVSNHVTQSVRTLLVVHEPPVLKEPDPSQSVVEVEAESSASLDCELARGEPRPNITWLYNGVLLRSQKKRHVFVNDSEVYISSARKEWHQGHYQCFATNILGQTYVQFLVRVNSNKEPRLEPPPATAEAESPRQRKHQRVEPRLKVRLPAPPRPSATQVADSTVELRWPAIPATNLAVQFLKVQYMARGTGDQWNTPDDEIEPTVRTFRIGNLAPRKYRFRLLTVFENQDHRSGKWSDWIVVAQPKNATEALPNKGPEPQDLQAPREVPQLTATPESATTIAVKWSMTLPEEIDGFELAYRLSDSGLDWHRERLPRTLPWTFTIDGLRGGSYYQLKIAAFNGRGLGNFSASIIAKTPTGLDLDQGHNPVEPHVPADNSIGSGARDLLRLAVYKQQAVLVFVLAGVFGLACFVFLACIAYYGRRLASDRINLANERIRRQREAAAYINDANSTFTPSISTVDLESTHGHPLEQTLEGLDGAESSDTESLSMKSVSHEEVPRSEKEYALKILTQLYATESGGHIVNLNGNFDPTRVQSV